LITQLCWARVNRQQKQRCQTSTSRQRFEPAILELVCSKHTRSGDSGLRPIKRVTTENIKRHCAVQVASPSSYFLFFYSTFPRPTSSSSSFIILFLPLFLLFPTLFLLLGTAVAQWLRCCATNRKVAASIPAGVNGFFIEIKSFRSHYVDTASNRNEYWEYFLGVKGGRCVRLTTLPPSCAVVTKSGSLNFLEQSGPVQACNGTDLPLPSSSFLLLILSITPLILATPSADSTCSHITLIGLHTQRHCRSCRTVTAKRRYRERL